MQLLSPRYRLPTMNTRLLPYPRLLFQSPTSRDTSVTNILCLSTAIYAEFSELLYSRSVFRLSFWIGSEQLALRSSFRSTANYKRIKKVEIIISTTPCPFSSSQRHDSMNAYDLSSPRLDILEMCRASIDQFIGDQPLRDSIHLQWPRCTTADTDPQKNPDWPVCGSTLPKELHESVTQLRGFQQVVLEVCSKDDIEDGFRGLLRRSTARYCRAPPFSYKILDQRQVHFDKFIHAVGQSLKASLGPYSVSDSKNGLLGHAKQIVFHPRKYLAVESMKVVGASQLM